MAQVCDSEMIALFRLGDKQAFKGIYMKYHDRIYNFCLKLIADENEAQDIVQLVFIALWNQREQIEINKPIESYIYALARYTVYHAFRKRLYQKAVLENLMEEPQYADEIIDEIAVKELGRYLEELIEKLPPKRKEIFKLNRTEGLTYKEIATRLNISENTVDTQIRKSLIVLRQEYEKRYK
jgi:RNA polymerase sigma-70 factor (ECF subfamily)